MRLLKPALSCILGLLLAVASANAYALYKWVDENGKVHYGDKIPPQYAKKQREELDKQGNVRKVMDREKTSEELKAAEDARKQQELDEKKAKEQAAYDRYLLTTYPNVDAIIKARGERLQLFDKNLKQAQESQVGTEKSLGDLRKRTAAIEKNGKPIPPPLQKQVKEHEARLRQTQTAIKSLTADRKTTETKYDNDLTRYRELKKSAGVVPADMAPAPP